MCGELKSETIRENKATTYLLGTQAWARAREGTGSYAWDRRRGCTWRYQRRAREQWASRTRAWESETVKTKKRHSHTYLHIGYSCKGVGVDVSVSRKVPSNSHLKWEGGE